EGYSGSVRADHTTSARTSRHAASGGPHGPPFLCCGGENRDRTGTFSAHPPPGWGGSSGLSGTCNTVRYAGAVRVATTAARASSSSSPCTGSTLAPAPITTSAPGGYLAL